VWIGSAFLAALGLAAGTLAIFGNEERGIDIALQMTARLAFLFFWLAYVASALVSLFGGTFQPVKRHTRELGLAFASVLVVHLGLVARLCTIGAAPPIGVFVIFGLAAFCTYIMALFSMSGLQHRLGPKGWWWLRTIVMNYVAFAFAFDFLKDPFTKGIVRLIEYLPFAILAIAGPGMRLLDWMLRLQWPWQKVLSRRYR
jgi:hypothetical protein